MKDVELDDVFRLSDLKGDIFVAVVGIKLLESEPVAILLTLASDYPAWKVGAMEEWGIKYLLDETVWTKILP